MNVSDFRAAFDKLPSHGWLDLDEALLLVDYASRTFGDMVEVGSYYGRSACLLAQLETGGARTRMLTCIDPWENTFPAPNATGDEVFQAFNKNMYAVRARYGFYRGRVEDWVPVQSNFVYLDGDHSYLGTVNQINKALKCYPDIIAVHDVNDSGGGVEVKRACLELLGPWKERVNRLAVWELKR